MKIFDPKTYFCAVTVYLTVTSCGQAQEHAPVEDERRETESHRMRDFSSSRLNGFDSQSDADSSSAAPPVNIAGASLVGECYYLDPGVLSATLGYLTCKIGEGTLQNSSGIQAEIKFRSRDTLTVLTLS